MRGKRSRGRAESAAVIVIVEDDKWPATVRGGASEEAPLSQGRGCAILDGDVSRHG